MIIKNNKKIKDIIKDGKHIVKRYKGGVLLFNKGIEPIFEAIPVYASEALKPGGGSLYVEDGKIYAPYGLSLHIYEDTPTGAVRTTSKQVFSLTYAHRGCHKFGDYLYVLSRDNAPGWNRTAGYEAGLITAINLNNYTTFTLPSNFKCSDSIKYGDNILVSLEQFGGFQIFDLTDPANPVKLSEYCDHHNIEIDHIEKEEFQGGKIFVLDGNRYMCVTSWGSHFASLWNVNDFTNPEFIRWIEWSDINFGVKSVHTQNLVIDGDYGYFTLGSIHPTATNDWRGVYALNMRKLIYDGIIEGNGTPIPSEYLAPDYVWTGDEQPSMIFKIVGNRLAVNDTIYGLAIFKYDKLNIKFEQVIKHPDDDGGFGLAICSPNENYIYAINGTVYNEDKTPVSTNYKISKFEFKLLKV